MVRMGIVAVIGLILAPILPPSLQAAEKQCDFQADIVTVADYVLNNRAGLARFKGLRYGAISAYLKLRYGKLPDKDAEAMLMPLVQARVSRADELMFAWAIDVYGVDAAGAILGSKTADLLLRQGYSDSVMRAAVVKEGLPALVAQMKVATPQERFRVESRLPFALLDKFDTYKADVQRQAEANGWQQTAAGLAAIQDDPKAWNDLAGRISDRSELQRMLSLLYWTPALVGNRALAREPAADPESQKTREQLHQVLIASAMMPERDFLATYANQTGKLDDVVEVSETIQTVAENKGDAPWTMDRAWIIAYLDMLAKATDPGALDKALRAIPFGGLRHYDGSVRDALDWMMAADALKSYILRQSDIKAKPELISAEFGKDWSSWQKAADLIRTGTDAVPLQASPKMQAIAAELLFAAGKQHELAGLIASSKAGDDSVSLAEDFAGRMDRICYGYLNFPAEAVTYPDMPLFRFD